MSTIEIILRLGLVALLGCYLFDRHRRRAPAAPLKPEDPSWWTGHGIDTGSIRPDLESARAGYRTAIQTGRSVTEGAGRVVAARAMVCRLAYFRSRPTADAGEHPGV
jgi:hypothetical protein